MNVTRLMLLLAGMLLAAAPALAVLGEDEKTLRQRFGRPEPQLRPQKNQLMWSIETDHSEWLMYTVTFDDKGRSIAEGLKPVKIDKLPEKIARAFVDSQLGTHRGAATREVQPGERYTFAGQAFTCGANETVFVDEEKDFMIVWVRTGRPLVMAVRAEMIR